MEEGHIFGLVFVQGTFFKVLPFYFLDRLFSTFPEPQGFWRAPEPPWLWRAPEPPWLWRAPEPPWLWRAPEPLGRALLPLWDFGRPPGGIFPRGIFLADFFFAKGNIARGKSAGTSRPEK